MYSKAQFKMNTLKEEQNFSKEVILEVLVLGFFLDVKKLMNFYIILAHPESKSFNSSIANELRVFLENKGHKVKNLMIFIKIILIHYSQEKISVIKVIQI